jgi:hypothetical protein
MAGLVVGFPFDTGALYYPQERNLVADFTMDVVPSESTVPKPCYSEQIQFNMECFIDHHPRRALFWSVQRDHLAISMVSLPRACRKAYRMIQATVALMNGLVFASYHFLMKLQLEHANAIPTLGQIALAGAGSGIISS